MTKTFISSTNAGPPPLQPKRSINITDIICCIDCWLIIQSNDQKQWGNNQTDNKKKQS